MGPEPPPERRTSHRIQVDERCPGGSGHDDVINAAAGALVLAATPRVPLTFIVGGDSDEDPELQRAEAAREVEEAIREDGVFWPDG